MAETAYPLDPYQHPKKEPHFFLDMDGVLVNLDKEIDSVFGPRTTKTFDADWRDLHKAKPNMFLEAEPMPDMGLLWKYVQGNYDNVKLLTAIPRREHWPECTKQKRNWATKHLGIHEVNVLFGPFAEDKQYHCPKGCTHYVLIDDNEKNIEQWNARGGTAIYHTNAVDTIGQLQKLGY